MLIKILEKWILEKFLDESFNWKKIKLILTNQVQISY